MSEDQYDDSIISEGAEYSAKSEFSKPKLVEEAVRKCVEARSKEMINGYYNYKFDKEGIPLKIWIPDQREVFISSIEALRNLLSPEIKQNGKFQEVEKKIRSKKKEMFDKYCYTETVPEFNGEDRLVYKKTDLKYIPNKGEKVCLMKISPGSRKIINETVGGWDRKVDFYLDEMVKLNDELFSALNELVDSLNYFKTKSSF
tara:strand:- start:3026 stop:3628 length:603 start_codon:yes stop_codon:yes gene_type:complete